MSLLYTTLLHGRVLVFNIGTEAIHMVLIDELTLTSCANHTCRRANVGIDSRTASAFTR